MTHVYLGLNISASARAAEPSHLPLDVNSIFDSIFESGYRHSFARKYASLSDETTVKEPARADAVLPNRLAWRSPATVCQTFGADSDLFRPGIPT